MKGTILYVTHNSVHLVLAAAFAFILSLVILHFNSLFRKPYACIVIIRKGHINYSETVRFFYVIIRYCRPASLYAGIHE